MKCDFDELRDLLFQMENEPSGTLKIRNALNDDPKPHQRALILCDVGLFEEFNNNAFRMTNEGHDFLDLIRDDEVWAFLKEEHQELAATGRTLTFSSIKELAPSAIRMVQSRKKGGEKPLVRENQGGMVV